MNRPFTIFLCCRLLLVLRIFWHINLDTQSLSCLFPLFTTTSLDPSIVLKRRLCNVCTNRFKIRSEYPNLHWAESHAMGQFDTWSVYIVQYYTDFFWRHKQSYLAIGAWIPFLKRQSMVDINPYTVSSVGVANCSSFAFFRGFATMTCIVYFWIGSR